MNILAIGNKIISETLNLPDELKPTEREIATMVSFLHKLSSKATPELAALREAGEKMAKQLRDLRGFQEEAEMRGQSSIIIETEYIFNTEDAAALAEWEAANK